MTSRQPVPTVNYVRPAATVGPEKQLVVFPGTSHEQRFGFHDCIEIGRYSDERKNLPGTLLLLDPAVSLRHCVITQTQDGRCYVRDMSRNGTKLNGRRLVPNVEVEFKVGQSICVGNQYEFLLAGEPANDAARDRMDSECTAIQQADLTAVTVLVGDIRDYSALVQRPDSVATQRAIRRVFHELQDKLTQLGGTVKEYRGDAIFAFWEKDLFENQAIEACRAALALDELAVRLAADTSVWNIPDAPLQMEWALATGPVVIDRIGEAHAAGLSLMGAPVVLAFRMEKYANHETGRIVACPETRDRAGGAFEFGDIGERDCKGFGDPVRVYSLIGPR